MLTGKQRAYLRGLVQKEEAILHIGKAGLTDAVLEQAKSALKARELIKCKVLENSPYTAAEAQAALCEACDCDGVQVIGKVFSLYKRNAEKPVIVLPKDKK